MQYKHLTNGIEINKFNLSEIVNAMTLKHKPSKMSRGASYEEIAYAWLYVVPFKVLKYRLYPRQGNAIQGSPGQSKAAHCSPRQSKAVQCQYSARLAVYLLSKSLKGEITVSEEYFSITVLAFSRL